MATSAVFPRAAARDGRGFGARQPRRRRRDRRARMERRHLGARRGRDDPARPLWRALGHHRPGRRPRPDATAGESPIETGRRWHHRLRRYQRRLSQGGAELPDPRHRRARRRQSRGGRGARERIWRAGARRSTRCSPIPRSRSCSTSRSPRRMSRSACRRSPPASTSIPKSRSASMSPRRGRLIGGRRGGGCASAARPTRSSAARHQTCRKLIDEGAIGRPIGGTAFFMCPGHERWHPNPGFYYLEGGGPMLDMGPYYITDLVNLLGPVASVVGVATRAARRAADHERAAQGHAHSGRGRDPCGGNAEFASGAVVADRHELRRAAPQARADRDLWRARARCSCPTRIISAARSNSPTADEDWRDAADRACLCRRQLPHHRRRRHGAGDPRRPSASRERRARLPCARSHGGVPEFVRSGAAVTIESRPERPAMLPTASPSANSIEERAAQHWSGQSKRRNQTCARH